MSYHRKWEINPNIMRINPDIVAQHVFDTMKKEFNDAASTAENLLIKNLQSNATQTSADATLSFYGAKAKAYQFLFNGSNGLYDIDIWEEYLQETSQLRDEPYQNGNTIRMAFELHGIPAIERLLKAQIRKRIRNAIATISTNPTNRETKTLSQYPNNIIS